MIELDRERGSAEADREVGGSDRIEDLPTLVRTAARRWPERTLLSFPATGESATCAEFDGRSDALAAGLVAQGVSPGDRVAVMLPNRLDFPVAWIGIVKAGGVMVPLNVFYQAADAAHVLQNSGATVLITDGEHLPLARDMQATCESLTCIVSVDGPADGVLDLAAVLAGGEGGHHLPRVYPEETANLQYTSGTTGHPKGCVLSNYYWVRLARMIAAGPPHLGPDDVLLTAQPFYYMDPQWNLAVALLVGGELVVLDRFHPSTFWQDVRSHGVTFFYCLGMMPTALHNMPPDPADRDNRVRGIACSAIPARLHAQLEERWGAPWYEAFGMTETGGDLRVFEREQELLGTACIGRPYPDREIRVADADGNPVPRGTTGELLVRGAGMMDGYFLNPEATRQAFDAGFFHTGDVVRQDEAGRVFYIGRTKDMIRRSGENIAAAEVEAVLTRHPHVAEAACVPVPDELRGEEVKVYVVPTDGRPDPAQLREWLSGQLAYFKVPRYWTFVDQLPKTPSERVAKGELTAGVEDLRTGAWDSTEDGWR
ncbi:MAG: acyl-CoA synthetase [Blastococcus sp.]|nr:acyl-CoA synthetase [Blastococcus sp.]